jgi:hypothetical protein
MRPGVAETPASRRQNHKQNGRRLRHGSTCSCATASVSAEVPLPEIIIGCIDHSVNVAGGDEGRSRLIRRLAPPQHLKLLDRRRFLRQQPLLNRLRDFQ